jgi:hypothetical protein
MVSAHVPSHFKRGKTKYGFCACAIIFQTQSTWDPFITTLGNATKKESRTEQLLLGKGLCEYGTCCEEIMKEKTSLFCQKTSKLVFFKSSSGTRTSPPVPSDVGYEDPDDLPQTTRNSLLPKLPFIESSWNVMAHGDAREGEEKGKLANGVGRQYPSHYLGTWCMQHYYR